MISSLIAASKNLKFGKISKGGQPIPILVFRDIALFAGLAFLYLEYKGTLEIVADEAVFDIMQLQSFLYFILFVLREAFTKKKQNFMKKFHKTVAPPPRTAFMKSLFRILTVF